MKRMMGNSAQEAAKDQIMKSFYSSTKNMNVPLEERRNNLIVLSKRVSKKVNLELKLYPYHVVKNELVRWRLERVHQCWHAAVGMEEADLKGIFRNQK